MDLHLTSNYLLYSSVESIKTVYDYDVIMQRNGDRDRLRMFKWSVVWKIDRVWLNQGEILVRNKIPFNEFYKFS